MSTRSGTRSSAKRTLPSSDSSTLQARLKPRSSTTDRTPTTLTISLTLTTSSVLQKVCPLTGMVCQLREPLTPRDRAKQMSTVTAQHRRLTLCLALLKKSLRGARKKLRHLYQGPSSRHRPSRTLRSTQRLLGTSTHRLIVTETRFESWRNCRANACRIRLQPKLSPTSQAKFTRHLSARVSSTGIASPTVSSTPTPRLEHASSSLTASRKLTIG